MSNDNPPKYVTVAGQEYVLVTYAAEQMLQSANDALLIVADFVGKYGPGNDELANHIRSLRSTKAFAG